jgi:hypothetical protein
LACLKEPWDSLCRNERREYDMVGYECPWWQVLLYNFLLTKVSLFKIPKQETVRYLEVRLKRNRTNSKNSSLLQEASREFKNSLFKNSSINTVCPREDVYHRVTSFIVVFLLQEETYLILILDILLSF